MQDRLTPRDCRFALGLGAAIAVELGLYHRVAAEAPFISRTSDVSRLLTPLVGIVVWYALARGGPTLPWWFRLATLVVVGGGPAFLAYVVLVQRDAQGALIFLFLPIYQLAVIGVALILSAVVRLVRGQGRR